MTPYPPLPIGVNFEFLLEQLRFMCWGAADILLAYSSGEQPPYGFPRALDIDEGGEGPVSAADLAVNSWLLGCLDRAFPNAPWSLLSEENAKEQIMEGKPCDAEWLWILDPLDGTKDFLQGSGDYAVHLALVHKNRPQLGVVLIPAREELWIGSEGVGAWCEDRSGSRGSVQFSKRKEVSELVLVSSRNHRENRLDNLIRNLSFGNTKKVGSVGCKVATILRGDADVYLSLSGKTAPKDWDMAAPEAVLVAAGGRFTHCDGTSLSYNKVGFLQSGCLIASHGASHPLICSRAKNELKKLDPEFFG